MTNISSIQGDWASIVSIGTYKELDTTILFNSTHKEKECSPIDEFIENVNRLTILYKNPAVANSSDLYSLVLLGYVSAVESYVRALIRGLIHCDEYSEKLVGKIDVKFGAAFHTADPKLLPEALTEPYSFISHKNVTTALKDLTGVEFFNSSDVYKVSREFDKICQIRHCCVHRFSKLGAKNAMELGIKAHKNCLEKPLNLTASAMDDIALVLRCYVKAINNAVFKSIIQRTAPTSKGEKERIEKQGILLQEEWTWNYSTDKKRFLSYYSLFASQEDGQSSKSVRVIYDELKKWYDDEKIKSTTVQQKQSKSQ
jgi:hypothetical protein